MSKLKAGLHAETKIRRLVKRKRPKPAAPDRVMVAAALMPALVASHLKHSDFPVDQAVMNRDALEWADAMIAEGAK